MVGAMKISLALNTTSTLSICRAMPRELPAGDVPDRIPVIPAGVSTGVDGRVFMLDQPEAVVRAFKAAGRDLPVDVEHATHIKGPKGDPAPAVGWIKDLSVEAGAIIATVAWNAAGRDLVAGQAYRFYSPAFMHDDKGHVIALRSLGLTNEPNFLDLPSLNREIPQESHQESTMDRTKLIALLGLAATATDAEIEAAISASIALNRAGGKPDPALYVPKADLDAALNRATTAETQLKKDADARAEADAVALVDGAIKDGKVAPASREHYLSLCRAGQADTVKAMLATLPKLGAAQESKTEGDPAKGQTVALDDAQLAICRRLGITPDDYQAAGKAA